MIYLFSSYTLDVEAVSCDELFVDCTTLLKKTGADPLDFASVLRQEIKVINFLNLIKRPLIIPAYFVSPPCTFLIGIDVSY